MENELFEAWGKLEDSAREIIRRDRRFAETDFLIQLLVLPSFGPFVSWEICRRPADSNRRGYFALRTAWNRSVDLERLGTPPALLRNGMRLSPTIEMEEYDLADEYVGELIGAISVASIPPFPAPAPFGIDGTTYEFYLHESFATARYAWWEHPPASWKPLGDIFHATLNHLDAIRREMG